MVHYQCDQNLSLQRSTTSRRICPASHPHALSPSASSTSDQPLTLPCRRCSSTSSVSRLNNNTSGNSSNNNSRLQLKFSSLFRSLLNFLNMPTCKFLALPSSSTSHLISLSSAASGGRRITGTLFGQRKGHVTFAVQPDTRSDPVLLVELAVSTANLVKEMSSGLVRIALECEKRPQARGGHGGDRRLRLFEEPLWTMYCNGRKCGYAFTRCACNDSDWRVLSTLSRLSVGAGVIPPAGQEFGRKTNGGSPETGEVLYMRARFERVVGSRDSEAFYMLNPDNNGGPELSIFLLRI